MRAGLGNSTLVSGRTTNPLLTSGCSCQGCFEFTSDDGERYRGPFAEALMDDPDFFGVSFAAVGTTRLAAGYEKPPEGGSPTNLFDEPESEAHHNPYGCGYVLN